MNNVFQVNILLVDDRPENLLALEAILDSPDYRLVRAHSAEEALKCLLTDDFAVILLDVQMPGLNGFETAMLIKKRERSKYIPIIFLTAISKEDQYVFKGYSVGAVDYMFKPFHPDLLRSKVAVFADLYKKNQALLREREARAGVEAGHRYLSFLVDLSTLLASTLDYQATLEGVARFAVPRFADDCIIDMLEGESLRRAVVASADPARKEFIRTLQERYPPKPEAPYGAAKVLRTGVPEHYREVTDSLLKGLGHDDAFLKIVKQWGVKSAVVVPIAVRGRTLGTMTLLSAESGRVYSDEDLAITHELARRAAFAIDHARLYREAQEEIAERKRAEAALKESEARFRLMADEIQKKEDELRLITNALPVLISYVDAEQRYRFNNKAYEAWFGHLTDEVRGKTVREVLGEAAYKAIQPFIEAALKGERMSFERWVPYKEGGERYVSAAFIPHIGREEKVEGYIALFTDLTERKWAEEALKRKSIEAEEASRIKSEFVSNVSHELRTPLNAILGYTHLLLDDTYGPLKGDQKVPLQGVLRNAEDLVNLVNGVLDLSKIESGKLSVILEEVDLVSVVQDILSGMKPLFREKSLQVRLNKAKELPAIQSDREKIRQIVVNLLSNALKFTIEGEITITLRSLPERDGIEVGIKDTGIGIQQEELPKIFNAFHQVDATSTREFGGVGLGLAIVKELTGLLKGEIRVESNYGKGSTFTLFLPCR
ncbi:MAG TPA: ATP-binding protein, partial [Candidatus Manganitrophaceae bacterium]|nr:ATP-binding protein [Candidatus Manganitrophaceae bacterium]